MDREQFDKLERHLCDSYSVLDRAAKNATEQEKLALNELSESALDLYNKFCEFALPMLSESDRQELQSTRQKTHLLGE